MIENVKGFPSAEQITEEKKIIPRIEFKTNCSDCIRMSTITALTNFRLRCSLNAQSITNALKNWIRLAFILNATVAKNSFYDSNFLLFLFLLLSFLSQLFVRTRFMITAGQAQPFVVCIFALTHNQKLTISKLSIDCHVGTRICISFENNLQINFIAGRRHFNIHEKSFLWKWNWNRQISMATKRIRFSFSTRVKHV